MHEGVVFCNGELKNGDELVDLLKKEALCSLATESYDCVGLTVGQFFGVRRVEHV